jgi:hypothetical protein
MFYKLCWSHEGGGIHKFNVEIDDVVHLVGPGLLDAECTMGLACGMSITGHLLESSNSLLVIPGGSTCGSDNAAAIAQWDATDPTPAVNYDSWGSVPADTVADDDASATYDFGTPVEGVPGPIYKICWSHDSQAAVDHLVELGVFTLNGPDVASFTCYIGGECVMNVTGYGFDSSNELVIVYGPYDQINGVGTSGAGCGDEYFSGFTCEDQTACPGVMPASLSYPARTEFGTTKYTYSIGQAFGAVGTHYKLCWSHAPSATIPAGLPQFKVTVNGEFELAYPVDDDDAWQETSSGGSGGFLAPKAETAETYHDDATGLDLVFKPPA